MTDAETVIVWWSAGVTSAIAAKLAVQKYGPEGVRLIYFQIDSAHPDNARFKRECEAWYGKTIEVWRSPKYVDQFDVVKRSRYVNGPTGAPCTKELKRNVRFRVEKEVPYKAQIFGFEFSPKEINRALRFLEQYPAAKGEFPLIEHEITKSEALHMLEREGIERPTMYKLGYSNNNCIGCVKGGAGYWNKIRVDFPEHFRRMAGLEREIGATCLRVKGEKKYLDELSPTAGRRQKIVMPECGNFCDLELSEIEHPRLQEVLADGKTLPQTTKTQQETHK